jgi:pyruvate/oxaloacetate carboxyltransferase
MSAYYRRILDHTLGALMRVQFTTQGSDVIDYGVVLLLETEKGMETIRVYDAAHDHNEMHRYTRSAGKEPGTVFHSGTLGEGMRAAISEVERGYREMIEGWERQ